MSRRRVEVTLERRADAVEVHWDDGRRRGGATFVHAPGARPGWLAAEEDLVAGLSGSAANVVVAAVADAAAEAGLVLGLWAADGAVEELGGS